MNTRNHIGAPEMRSGILYLIGYIAIFSVCFLALWNLSAEARQSAFLLQFTAFCSICATTFGKMLLGSIARYPGVEANSYVLPAFSASFGALLLFLILGRADYSRAMLVGGFFSAIIWSYIWNLLPARRKTLRVGIVPFGDYRALRTLDGVTWVTLEHPAQDVSTLDAVALDLRSNVGAEWERRLADFALEGLPVYHSKHLVESLSGRVELQHLSENSFGTLSPMSAYMLAKHATDWLLALVIGTAIVPVMLLIGLLIRLESPGPIIFRQTRIGYRGKPFTVYKLRTMHIRGLTEGSGDELRHAITLEGDKRVTVLGAILRKSRLDELPQILNIIKGEMSWIGPRPEAEVLSRWYEAELPFYGYRHIVRPGITGWAQVNQGHVAEVEDVLNKLHFDFYYIKNFSPWLDLLIVFRTIKTMATGFGAR